MAGKRKAVRQEFTNRLLEAAMKRIAKHGLSSLRARNVTEDAGCALGTIYKCFVDFDDLILHVNSKTLAGLGEAMDEALATCSEQTPPFEALALAYARFAKNNINLWAALFDHRMAEGVSVPDWHVKEHEALFGNVISILTSREEGLDRQEAFVRARTYFSAIHGVVSISLQDRFVGIPSDKLEQEIKMLTKLF